MASLFYFFMFLADYPHKCVLFVKNILDISLK